MQSIKNYFLMAILLVLFIVPFAIPIAYFPLAKFESELISLICGMLLLLLTICVVDSIRITYFGVAAFLFAAFILCQPIMVPINFIGNNYYVALLFVVIGLTSISISSLHADDLVKQQNIMQYISWALVISALIQSIIAYMQYTGSAANYQRFMMFISNDMQDGSNIFGNIGQPNQFTDLISLGVVAATYLVFSKKMNSVVYAVSVIIFASAIAFTARRGVLLYYVMLLCLLLVLYYRSSWHSSCRNILLLFGSFFILLITMELLLPVLSVHIIHQNHAITAISRLASNEIGQSTYRRFYEWYKALVIFIQHPLIGIGWYQYAHSGIYLMTTDRFMHIPQNMKLYTHCHNSLFNMLAETGIVGTSILVGYGICYSVYKLLNNMRYPVLVFAGCLTIPLLTHSLLEFPLWYSYFLIPLSIFLSFNAAIFVLPNSRIMKTIVSVMIFGFSLSVMHSYQENTRLVQSAQPPSDYDDFAQNTSYLTHIIDNNDMFALAAAMVLDSYIIPAAPEISTVLTSELQLSYIDKIAYELPYPMIIIKQIILHKLANDDALAQNYANVLVHAYPFFKQQFIRQFASDPLFSDILPIINNFKYKEDLTLQNWLHAH